MNIGRMDEIIRIEKNETKVDSYGNHMSVWSPYFRCHAYVSTWAGSESHEGGVTSSNATVTFSVRCCAKTKVLDSNHYHVIFRGDTYDIEAVDPMNYQGKEIKIRATKERK